MLWNFRLSTAVSHQQAVAFNTSIYFDIQINTKYSRFRFKESAWNLSWPTGEFKWQERNLSYNPWAKPTSYEVDGYKKSDKNTKMQDCVLNSFNEGKEQQSYEVAWTANYSWRNS